MEFPNTKATKDAIRAVIGTDVTFVVQGTPSPCPVCSGAGLFDEVNEASLNSFCTTCSGLYWLTVDDEIEVNAHVRWAREDEPSREVGGSTLMGDCYITVAIDALTTTQISKVKEVRVDGRKLEVYRAIMRGVPTRDRIRFVCREWGKEN